MLVLLILLVLLLFCVLIVSSISMAATLILSLISMTDISHFIFNHHYQFCHSLHIFSDITSENPPNKQKQSTFLRQHLTLKQYPNVVPLELFLYPFLLLILLFSLMLLLVWILLILTVFVYLLSLLLLFKLVAELILGE